MDKSGFFAGYDGILNTHINNNDKDSSFIVVGTATNELLNQL